MSPVVRLNRWEMLFRSSISDSEEDKFRHQIPGYVAMPELKIRKLNSRTKPDRPCSPHAQGSACTANTTRGRRQVVWKHFGQPLVGDMGPRQRVGWGAMTPCSCNLCLLAHENYSFPISRVENFYNPPQRLHNSSGIGYECTMSFSSQHKYNSVAKLRFHVASRDAISATR